MEYHNIFDFFWKQFSLLLIFSYVFVFVLCFYSCYYYEYYCCLFFQLKVNSGKKNKGVLTLEDFRKQKFLKGFTGRVTNLKVALYDFEFHTFLVPLKERKKYLYNNASYRHIIFSSTAHCFRVVQISFLSIKSILFLFYRLSTNIIVI